jgi:UDP-glucose 4-epimerase
MSKKSILITGGLGYIGSHTSIELIEAGFKIIIVDNLCNSSIESLYRLKKLVKFDIPFYNIDIRDKDELNKVFHENNISGVIHFAGLKSVNESIKKPIEYYDNNINGTIALIQVMKINNCKTLIFSSSATVYGNPKSLPITENFPLSAANPYGNSKLFIEGILQDLYNSDKDWRISFLRYFNPVGAHKSGLIGESPNGTPNNLMPFISQVAVGKLKKLKIFGGDYETIDGTGVRDYIHVIDLAKGHIRAMIFLEKKSQLLIANLGTGIGYSVLEMIEAFKKASGCEIPYEIVGRRTGDIAKCFADVAFAKKMLGWEAKHNLQEMCEDTWKWQSRNPNGLQ